MLISIHNAVQSTDIFVVLFLFAVIATFQKKQPGIFSYDLTQELKGFAILAIVFGHIGYFLANDHRFLFPLSIMAGVGVNLFLFLSGFGLVTSALSKPLSIIKFYKRRLLKLYLPLWLTVLLFFFLDFFVLHKFYGLSSTVQILVGFFPRADLWLDLNSPLWYFTLIVFYYILFPLVFFRRYPWISAIALFFAGYFLVQWNPGILSQVIGLYRLHIWAFPLGVFFGGLLFQYKHILFKGCADKVRFLKPFIYWTVVGLLLWIIGYFAYYSNVGNVYWLEEATSLLVCSAIIMLFLILKFESRVLSWFGLYSYEVYLIHWPLLSRFDIFYYFLPAWLATLGYLIFFLVLAWAMRNMINTITIYYKNTP